MLFLVHAGTRTMNESIQLRREVLAFAHIFASKLSAISECRIESPPKETHKSPDRRVHPARSALKINKHPGPTMENGHTPIIAAAVPRDYIFAIDYHAHGYAVHIVKGIRNEADAWR